MQVHKKKRRKQYAHGSARAPEHCYKYAGPVYVEECSNKLRLLAADALTGLGIVLFFRCGRTTAVSNV